MTSIRKQWNHFWFEAVSPDNLGLCRIVLFGTMFLSYVLAPRFFLAWGYQQDFARWGSVSRVFWNPVWLMSLLHLQPASLGVMEALQILWRASLLLSCIGFFTRISTVTSFALGLYFFGVAASFGKIHHMEHVLIFTFLIMALSRCGDAWSVDAVIRRVRGGAGRKPTLRSGEYTWPVRMIWVVFTMIYFVAGLSKLAHSGFEWVTTESMGNYLISHAYQPSAADPLTSWGPALARGFYAPRFLASIGLSVELAMPLALFWRRSRWVLVPSVMLMQFGVAVLLGPNFYQLILCQLLWVPWDRVVAWVTRKGEIYQKSNIAFDRTESVAARPQGAD